jgi:uncharacterized protein involved in exopolysaccharide biosynthesis
MTVGEKLDSFIQKAAEIVALDQEISIKVKEIEAKCNAECNELGKKAMQEASDLRAPLTKKLEEYRAEVKAEFGITDGEPMNVVQMLKAVHSLIQKGA